MGYKTLDLTLICAKDLKNASMFGKMDVYVVVSLSGDPTSKQKTKTHTDGGTSPCWNQTLQFTFDDGTALHADWSLLFLLKHDAFGPDKELGQVQVPIKDLLSGFHGKDEPVFATYPVKRDSGKDKGELKISYKITDTPVDRGVGYPPPQSGYPVQGDYPSQSYPAAPGYPSPQSGYPVQAGYPPPQSGYPVQAGYPQPSQQGYGYPQPPQQGYGYPQPPQQGYGYPQQEPKRGGGGSGMAMGLGVGLVGGAVGGLVVGEMLDDDDGGDDGDF